MRVVHVTPYFAPAFRYGGPPRSVLGLCHGLRSHGIDLEVVTTVSNGDTPLAPSGPEGDEYEGIPVHYAAQSFPRRYFGGALAAPLRRALDRADVCHIHGIWNAPEWHAASCARALGVPYLITPRGMLQPGALSRHRWRKQLMYHLVERRNLSGAARLHATAPEETVVLRRIVDPARVIEIPNGVDVAGIEHARAGARERLGIPARDPVVVFLGRLHPIKRIDLLAAAVARVRKRRPSTHLVIAGPDEGGQLAALQSALAPLGPFVHTPGALDDHQKASLLAEATTLVLCSDTESFGMAVVEAMASALPVVVSRTCGWSGIERDGCGWLVDQRVDDIADAIERVIADPQRAAEMGRRGAQLARERYSWHGVAAQMIACYEDVLAGRAVA